MPTGYANRVIKLDFEKLSADPEKDPIWVIIRNPKLLPPAEIQSLAGGGVYEQEKDAEGNPVFTEDGRPKMRATDPEAAQQHLRELIARLVVAARVYDGTSVGEYDPETGEPVGDQDRLPPTPWTPEVAAKLPLEIIERISREYGDALNPQAGPTQKKSSGPPSQSSTEPGAEAQPQPS